MQGKISDHVNRKRSIIEKSRFLNAKKILVPVSGEYLQVLEAQCEGHGTKAGGLPPGTVRRGWRRPQQVYQLTGLDAIVRISWGCLIVGGAS
jgi:hypothetical protein